MARAWPASDREAGLHADGIGAMCLVTTAMHLTINGQIRALDPVNSVAALLAELGFGERPVLVEHNGVALFPREFATVPLADGDKLEIIELAAGG